MLLAAGIIETDNSYKPGSFSKGYRIGPALTGYNWITDNFRDFLFSLNLRKIAYKEDRLTLWNQASSYFGLWKINLKGTQLKIAEATDTIIKDCHIDIDEVTPVLRQCAAEHYAAQVAESQKKIESAHRAIKRGKKDVVIPKEYEMTEDNIFDFYIFIVNLFNSGAAPLTFDKKTGRFFHCGVFLKKEARDFIRYKGRPLVGLDIRACQCCLLVQFYKDTPEDNAEKAMFIDFLTKSDIYTELGGGLPRPYCKEKMFTIFFGEAHHQSGKFWDAFAAKVPILANRITQQKINSKDYTSVSRMMQLLESRIMIIGVLNELIINNPFMALAIHDGLLVLPEAAALAEYLINEYFKKETGFAPVIVVE